MTENPYHPYTFEVGPGIKPGTFLWTIRLNGKLLQRSDRARMSEEEARKDGLKVLEREFTPAFTPRRG